VCGQIHPPRFAVDPFEEVSVLTGYCVKCKAKKEMKDAQKVTMKNGRPAMKGKCPNCGTGMYRILKPGT